MKAAAEAGMAVVAVGHRRSEMWGLHYLATRAREAFWDADVEVVVVDEEAEELRLEVERKARRQQLQREKKERERLLANQERVSTARDEAS